MNPKDIYYRRNLPHIHLEGYPIFITFNLTESIPKEVVAELIFQREQELKNFSPKSSEHYKIQKKYFGKFDKWLDSCKHRHTWLKNEKLAEIVASKIHSFENERYELVAFCIMLNHVHLLIRSLIEKSISHQGKTANYPLADTLKLIKGSTARECNLILGRTGSFWHHESYDHYVRDEEEFERIIKYILNNPVKARLVKEWNQWKFTYINPKFGNW
jgi:REP element-mobilizing transposase RayT